jgi:DNA-binding XRE family transcriptional regulator
VFVKSNDPTTGANMTAEGPPLATIAANLRREREHRGLSLSEAAKRAGVAKSTLSQLESAQGNPSVRRPVQPPHRAAGGERTRAAAG